MFWLWILMVLAFPFLGWWAHKRLRQLSQTIDQTDAWLSGQAAKLPSDRKRPIRHTAPRRKIVTQNLREALSRMTFYGAFTPMPIMIFNVFRYAKRKEWWQDKDPQLKARTSGPWDTPETDDDNIVDIVDIDFDIRDLPASQKEPQGPASADSPTHKG
ncbi:hypothetical protein HCZ23_03835 [Celeribacter sp. HF31]|uniref:hypothetical protein n=1 Tax=Celeribacter sp. HF31 TaxID=2721558 RepID=UPI001431DC0C|nr:hypothetical protein [Celeribacter sp. HF31]NIY78600.1 hypothetical protein [Celeribacter sp. HF31]